MDNTWINHGLLEGVEFRGNSAIDVILPFGTDIPFDTDSEFVDLLFNVESITTEEQISITYTNTIEDPIALPIYIRNIPVGTTALYFAPDETFLLPFNTYIHIVWANTDNKEYLGLIRYYYRAQVENRDIVA